MKKIIIVFLILIVSVVFFSCSNNTEDKEKADTSSEKSTTHISLNLFPPQSSATETSSYLDDWPVEHVYMYVYGMKQELKLSQSLIDDLEKSKSVKSPKIDSLSLAKFGKLTVVEKSSEEEKEFGILYMDNTGKYYLQSLDNENNAVIPIDAK